MKFVRNKENIQVGDNVLIHSYLTEEVTGVTPLIEFKNTLQIIERLGDTGVKLRAGFWWNYEWVFKINKKTHPEYWL